LQNLDEHSPTRKAKKDFEFYLTYQAEHSATLSLLGIKD